MKLRKPKSVKYWKSERKLITLAGDSDEYTHHSFYFERSGKGYKHGYDAVEAAGYGASPLNPVAAYGSAFNGAMMVCTSEGVYIHAAINTAFNKVFSGLSGKIFFAEAYRDGEKVVVAFGGKERAVFNGSQAYKYNAQYAFTSGAVHCGRFFGCDASDAFKIRWSADGIFDWATGIYGSGYINLPAEGGEILRLFSMGDRLIAVRKSGITVVHAYGDPQHFAVDETANYMVTGGIIGDTCAACANKIFFCTEGGMYAFDGNGVKKLDNDDNLVITSPSSAVAYGDEYFVICSNEYVGSNLLYVYNATAKRGYFMNFQPDALCACGDGVYAFSGNTLYKIGYAERRTRGYWLSKTCDFGSDGVKYLREIYIEGDNDVSVVVICDGVSRTYTGSGWHTVGMTARSFSFVACAFGRLDKLQASVEAMNGI